MTSEMVEPRTALLPDAASSSSSSSSSSASPPPSLEKPVIWGILSNFLFLFGSVLQISTAIWDLKDVDDDSSDYAYDDDATAEWTPSDFTYYYLTVGGATMYVLNAVADLVQTCSEGGDNCWEIGAALSFGVGAVLELSCYTIFGSDETSPSYVTTMIVSMHVYLLSGILGGPICCCYCQPHRSPESLFIKRVSAFLFLLGALIDVTLSWLSDPAVLTLSQSALAWGNLTSTLTWLLAAILCVKVDCVHYSLLPCRGSRQQSRRAEEFEDESRALEID